MDRGDIIELRATDPNGELACDITIANEKARAGIAEGLRAGVAGNARRIDGGIEVPFRSEANDAVMRYIELESKCCSFLNLALAHDGDALLLRVTGRPEARDLIDSIFADILIEAS